MQFFRKSYSVNEVLENSKAALVGGLGDRLVSLIHFGNHLDQSLKADFDDKIQLLVVVRSINKEALDCLATSFNQINGRNQIAPMVLTQEELESSTDVFPTTFLEMTHFHELIHGEDILNGLEIETSYLRLRCEQELKNLLLRLQASYMTQYQETDLLGNLVHTGFLNLIKIFHSVRVLYGNDFSQGREQVLGWAAEQLNLDSELLKVLAQFDAQHQGRSREASLKLLGGLIKLVSDAAAAVDQIPDSVELVENGGS